MLFNSLDFAIFLPTVFLVYWFVTKNLKLQNFAIVIASYVFYGWWDWRFLSLILLSTTLDYSVGIWLSGLKSDKSRRYLILLSIIVNLGILGFFKYYNFFLENFISAFSLFGYKIHANSLNIILPVGISFYTFQTMSYTLDVYRKQIEPARDYIEFAAYVSFFPQLVAGPIERAKHLLPQFSVSRKFDYNDAVDGLRQMLWGFFKKIVIADNCANYANLIFNNSSDYNGSTLLLGAVFFAFQIYGDFSGYSDIAIGTARLFGFRIMRNFAYPYFSRDIAEFWRRWHISLTSWFRDYVYIPLGGSKGGILMKTRNTFIIFLLSGFWHGASWTFIIWGLLNAVYFLPLMLTHRNRNNIDIAASGRFFPNFKELTSIMVTFSLTVFAWIFFRANSLTDALNYISGIFSSSLFSVPEFPGKRIALILSVLIVLFVMIEWHGRENQYAIARTGFSWKRSYRFAFYYLIIAVILFFGGKEQEFIYFQF